MLNRIKRLFFLMMLVCCFVHATADDTLRVATYNIRVDTDQDTGSRDWHHRKEHIGNIIRDLYQFDLFGVQEIRSTYQQNSLFSLLTDTYEMYLKAVGNTEGTLGERNAIFFRTNRFTPLESGSFFLSETPEKPAAGWDAMLHRNCVWLKLKDRKTQHDFYFFCTHFDHKGVQARENAAKLVIDKIHKINRENLPVVLVGDFNSQEDKPAVATILEGGMSDSRALLSPEKITGPLGTTNGWNKPPENLKNRIDFIFVNSSIDVLSYSTITDKFYEDAYPSDHFPVMIKILFQKEAQGSSEYE